MALAFQLVVCLVSVLKLKKTIDLNDYTYAIIMYVAFMIAPKPGNKYQMISSIVKLKFSLAIFET